MGFQYLFSTLRRPWILAVTWPFIWTWYKFSSPQVLQDYSAKAGFPFPIDDEGGADHDFRHAVFEMVLNKKFCAPVNLEGANVLEIYTRTGILAMDIADEDPSCLVIGVDESEMQAKFVPMNLQFEVCDLEDDDDWTWRQRFRLIIIRQHGVFVKDLPALIRRCYE